MIRAMVAMLAGVLLWSEARACSPARDWSLEKEFSASRYVFRATVIRADTVAPAEKEQQKLGEMDFRYVRVFFEIEETLKGKPRDGAFAITWNAYVGGCGVPVVAGLSYVFFVSQIPDDAISMLTGNLAGTLGSISIFGTEQLPQNPKLINQRMARFRELQ